MTTLPWPKPPWRKRNEPSKISIPGGRNWSRRATQLRIRRSERRSSPRPIDIADSEKRTVTGVDGRVACGARVSFAASGEGLKVPEYIADGLSWLEGRLKKKQVEILGTDDLSQDGTPA